MSIDLKKQLLCIFSDKRCNYDAFIYDLKRAQFFFYFLKIYILF